MDDVKPIGLDETGFEVITKAVLKLLSEYPGLDGREILFEELEEESGIAFSADSGALVISETADILGGYTQVCRYPMFIIYRTNATRERQKLQIQTFLDTLGKWICQEHVEINGTSYRLTRLPELAQGRKITRITRLNSYGLDPTEAGVQDWLMPVTVEYTNEISPLW